MLWIALQLGYLLTEIITLMQSGPSLWHSGAPVLAGSIVPGPGHLALHQGDHFSFLGVET